MTFAEPAWIQAVCHFVDYSRFAPLSGVATGPFIDYLRENWHRRLAALFLSEVHPYITRLQNRLLNVLFRRVI